jgi:hypothetical protein
MYINKSKTEKEVAIKCSKPSQQTESTISDA